MEIAEFLTIPFIDRCIEIRIVQKQRMSNGRIFCGRLCIDVRRQSVTVVKEIDVRIIIAGRKTQVVEWRLRVLRILGGGQ